MELRNMGKEEVMTDHKGVVQGAARIVHNELRHIAEAEHVEVYYQRGKLWVNVDGRRVLRICRVTDLTIDDPNRVIEFHSNGV